MSQTENALLLLGKELVFNPDIANALSDLTLQILYLLGKGDVATATHLVEELDLVVFRAAPLKASSQLKKMRSKTDADLECGFDLEFDFQK